MPERELFGDPEYDAARPLADRMRPRALAEFRGQGHILAEGKPLRRAIEDDRPHSMIFWGPPGTGKTTLARLIAHHSGAQFISLSAVLSGVKEIRNAVEQARQVKELEGRPTVLFIDEVHRFNKAQQDAFLPHVEDGTVVFVGATTENPSFELNNALLSRARTYVLKRLALEELEEILEEALRDRERGLGERELVLAPELRHLIAEAADGDARRALNLLEIAADLSDGDTIPASVVQEVVSGAVRRFDKGGDLFYDQISALHKSVRGSAPDAALYWLCRMLDGGCDPLYLARRVVRMASEDIGNADPRALALALDAWETQERLGSPEGELTLAQAVLYMACAPKSNAAYLAFGAAMKDARSSGTQEVPVHLRNAPTRLMKELGYGREYRYAHDEPDAYAAGETYFPEEMGERRYYHPVERGLEIKIREKLALLRERDRKARKESKGE
jgi:putative ATPase